MAGQLFAGRFIQKLPQNCAVNTTPPAFSGITSITTNVNGSLQANWSAGTTSSKDPIEYLIYIALGSVSAATLFQSSNLVTMSPSGTTSRKVFTLANQTTYLIKNQIYTMGVRAKDSQGYTETNTAILTATATGYVDLPSVYQDIADQLDTAKDQIQAAASAITAGAGVQVSLVSTELTMTLEEDL